MKKKEIYDAAYIASFYDNYAEREWERLGSDGPLRNMVNYHIHSQFLKKFIKQESKVLEIGAGPGRFSIDLLKLGCRLVIADISDTQLNINREKVTAAGLKSNVIDWCKADVVDLSQWHDQSFDSIVCLGGPLSYVFDKAKSALKGMQNVIKSNGVILLSVMSTLGATKLFLPVANAKDIKNIGQILKTGVLTREINDGHPMKMYRWQELKEMVEGSGLRIIEASASNCLANQRDLNEQEIKSDFLDNFLDWETDMCRDSSAVGMGTHIIIACGRA